MIAEQKELYNYTKDRFLKELERITPNSASPIIAIRMVVKKAIDLYIKDYCSQGTKTEDVFSVDDFKSVSNKIYDDIINGGQ